MLPKFPEEVAYLGGLLRKSKLVETEKGFYEIHIEHEREFLEAVDAVLKQKLEGKYEIEDSKLIVHAPDVFDLLVAFFGHPDTDRRWALTDEIKNGREEHKVAFLRGLFDAFGIFETPVPKTQRSKTFDGGTLVLRYAWHPEDLKEVRALLAELGIKSVTKKNELHVRDTKNFAAKIGTLRPAHERRLITILAA